MNMHYAALLQIFFAIGSVAGCMKSEETGQQKIKVKPVMTMTYQVGNLQQGTFVPVGTITFDENHKGTLSLDKDNAAASKLRDVWSKVADKDKILVKRSETSENEKGEEVSKYIGVEVARSSEEFPQALMEYLSSEHGFFAIELSDKK
jgi:hypothetical protein